MNAILDLLARNALAASLLAAAALLATLFVKRPAVRNALWLVVLIRLLLPPIWSIPVHTPEVTADQAPTEQAPIAPPIQQAKTTNNGIGHERVADGYALASARWDDHSLTLTAVNADARPTVAAAVAANDRSSNSFHPPGWITPALFALWLGGSVIVLGLAFKRIRAFQHSLRDAIRAPDGVQQQAADIARSFGLRLFPTVWLVPGRVPPMLWMCGLTTTSAKLVLPVDLFFKLDPGQRSALIAHELAHLRRRDPWVRWLELLAVVVYWWHPLLGLMRRQLRDSEEQCCDAWVVARFGERRSYATALMETVEFLDGPDIPAAPALASGAGPVYHLQRRLTMIMRDSMNGRLTRLGVLAILGVAVTALAFGPAFSLAQPEGKKDRPFNPKEDGERPRERPKDRPFPPKENPGGPADEEIESLRKELNQAREEAEKAIGRVRQLEMKIRLASAGPDGPKGPPMRDLPMPPRGGINNPGGDRQLQDLQRQIEEMRRMIEDLRKDLRAPDAPERRDPPPIPERRRDPKP